MAPDRNSFNTVIKAYANAGGEHAVANAERILGLMERYTSLSSQQQKQQGQRVRKPAIIAPDKISYTSVLMAYANSGCSRKSTDAGERAEELLKRMARLSEEGKGGDVKPDTIAYNAVLKVW